MQTTHIVLYCNHFLKFAVCDNLLSYFLKLCGERRYMKKICFITAARSEYGLLKWLMYDIDKSSDFEMQLIVTGGHLLKEQGNTINNIRDDGFNIDAVVDADLDTSSTEEIANSMGRLASKLSIAFKELKPDYLVVLGDRYELLPICSTAFIMGIPIVHISGGDVTEGAIDDGVRNAITMLATYHFPETSESANNIRRMRGNDKNIWVTGNLGLDSFNREELMSRESLAENLGLDINSKWILMTYHSETKKSIDYNLDALENCLNVLQKLDGYQVVITYANADFGGKDINEFIVKAAEKYPEKFIVIPSLGHLRYLSYMKQAVLVVGNSSSGICEAPFLKTPVVNIGDRQKGRYQCCNIFQCATDYESIENCVFNALEQNIEGEDSFYWGDGHTAEKISNILSDIIK